MWAAIVFEEVPEEGALQHNTTHYPNPNPYTMHIYYPNQVPEEGALQQTWAYKLRFNASAVPSTKSRYDRYARGGYSGTHEAYRKSGLL